MANYRDMRASCAQLSRGALREGSAGDTTHTAAAATVAVVLFRCSSHLLLRLCSVLMQALLTTRALRERLTASDRSCLWTSVQV